MTWIKKGIIFDEHWAQLPIVDPYNNAPEPQAYKIYYSTRDEQGRSIPMTISCYKNNPKEYLHPIPVNIPLGKPGSFDSYGIMPSSIVTLEDGTKYMYYVGWSKRIDVPYWNSTGLAISKDNGITWSKISNGPILSQTTMEDGWVGTVDVSWKKIGKFEWKYKMLYSSCKWEEMDGKLEPTYDIREAYSYDNLIFEPKGGCFIRSDGSYRGRGRAPILSLKENEGGIASFRQVGDRFFYSKRNKSDYRTNIKNSYKIYSCDLEGQNEQLELSPSGEEIMCAYPFIIEEDKYIMFYNSDFGKSGISYAIKMK